MALAPDQLSEIHQQIRERFQYHPVISVKPLKGEPPDQYSISYAMRGICKNESGEITEAENHHIELTIPFGFPHFPPSCKPKSDIFHPDFDPGAICLGEFWQEQHDVVELITHLGKLINAEIYSTVNAFNEEALTWYNEKADDFPLSSIDWNRTDKPEIEDEALDLDSLDEMDIDVDFGPLSAEELEDQEESDKNESLADIEDRSSQDVNLSALQLLHDQKMYYQLLAEIRGKSHLSNQVSMLSQLAREEIDQAENIYNRGKAAEDEGNASFALTCYEKINQRVADFPSLQADINRINQTLQLLDNITGGVPGEQEILFEKNSGRPASREETGNAPLQSLPDTADFLGDQSPKSRLPLYLFLLAITVLVGGGTYYFQLATSYLTKAEAAHAQCLANLKNHKFSQAQTTCHKAEEYLSIIFFLYGTETKTLKNQLTKTLQSPAMKQGLQGKVLYDGKYIAQKDITGLEAMKESYKEAIALLDKQQWQEASVLLSDLKENKLSKKYLDTQTVEDLGQKLSLARFQITYGKTNEIAREGNFEQAIEHLLKTKKALKNLPQKMQVQYGQRVEASLQTYRFELSRTKGDQALAEGKWQQAKEHYQTAIDYAPLSSEVADKDRKNVEDGSLKADLYLTIAQGNKAFSQGQWDEAIKAYKRADSLIKENRNLLVFDDKLGHSSAISQNKLSRIVLQASIIRDRQTVKELLAENDLKKARRLYIQIISAINDSSFHNDINFLEAKEEISNALKDLDQKLYLQTKTDYLLKNYQGLFSLNYPAANPENLSKPVVTFVKETQKKIIFRMQCTEKKSGRPLTLVMFYAFIKANSKWELHTQN